ncbi:hypothetical protein EUGRSUZ_F01957 [Eucalyptus grandis]|uniref:Uncharacterized protein n=2 Tax=Eucalyptus grandis TaxID=71139 RepID=A0ACC3KGL2_EUCGR|nr:hypothetical protein EUGRSUZ_F01957 [Eucalyptus grandis]
MLHNFVIVTSIVLALADQVWLLEDASRFCNCHKHCADVMPMVCSFSSFHLCLVLPQAAIAWFVLDSFACVGPSVCEYF